MAFTAYVMIVFTAGFAVFFFMADNTFHKSVIFKIFKLCTADQAFVFHYSHPFFDVKTACTKIL